ncbi:uncharacterized protein LOC119082808 isoform X2 [Bradysia coprophila]|uniref:uncharacterized protein LOC119082808 isoform X2 n=1 Tax=Bradysia coprophila TaxID=38358 RepID=UPI00187DB620|nr:uncharacterized protein LOC119082808 isoform X2 [Bradysia coprophila]
MTKGRTENNRAWEKERRDRLNKSFDILAKFLPNYDDAAPFSKIEIIQKSILLIKDLQHKLKELLAGSHKDILNTILELEEAFKVLIVRNKVLLALVKKCGGTAPSFTEPKIFNCIVTSPLDENDLNELYVKQNGRPPKNGKGKGKRKLQTLHDDEEVQQKKRKIKLNKGDKKKMNNAEDEPTVADNTKVKEQNGDPAKADDGNVIEKVVDDKPSSAIPNANSEPKELKAELKPSPRVTSVVATGILLPISNIKKSINLESGPIIVVNALPKVSTLLPKPVAPKGVPGKIAISPLKSKTVPRRQRIRRTKKEIERERKCATESKSITSLKKSTDDAVIDSDGNKCDPNSVPDAKVNENDVSKQQDTQSDNNRIETTEPTLPQPELSNDILASLQIPQNDSNDNNESLSPTAAFLMSFPVVSSAGVRIGDDEHEAHDSQSIQQPHSTNKPASEANILENISSLLTTKDYDRFVGDAVGSETVHCETSSKPNRDKQNEICVEKSAASMSFDFQLKPIISSCSEVKTDTGLRVSVTCTSTYLPEIGTLSYKSSPSKRHRKSTNDESSSNVTAASTTQDSLLSMAQPKISTVSTDDYVRNHTAMDFITSSSTVLHSLEPPSLMHRLTDTIEQVKRTETTPLENLFLRNVTASCSVNTPSSYSTVYSYDKGATTVTTSDTKTTASESANYNLTAAVPSIMSHAITSQAKSRKTVETPNGPFNFTQPMAVSAADTSDSIKSCRENQFNSLHSYSTNTTTYSSTSLSNFSCGTTDISSTNPKPYQDNTAKTTASTSVDKTFFKPSHSTSSAVDGFYTSLTSIGTTHSNLPDYPSSIMRPNMYTSALSLSSSSNQKALDYTPQTPFTFSLTTPISTVSNSKSTTLASCQQSQNYLPTTHSTSYQDFNPFAFENIASIPAPITPYSTCRETSQFSFSLTSTTNKVTSKYPSQSSFSIDQNFLTETRPKPVTPVKSESHSDKKGSYKHCPKEAAVHPSDQIKIKDTVQKVEKSNPKQHVNWMTSTTDLQKNDYPIIPPIDYTQPASLSNQFIPQPTSQLTNSQKNADIYFGHQIGEENFQWSPNKMIDTPSFNSTTLPNLHGDLALNNSITPKPQISSTERNKSSKPMQGTHMSHMHLPQQNVAPNPTNSYFSVSQLVDHPKTAGQSKSYDDSVMQPKTTKSNSNNQSRFKHKESKKVAKPPSNVSNFTPNIFVESFAYNEPQKPNNSNSYSAEALISVHPSKKETKSLPTYGNQSDYCNQLDTFNNMDYLNESNYNYYNNSYFPQISDTNEYFCGGSYSDQQFHNKTSRSSAPSTKHLTGIADTAYGSHTAQNNFYSLPHPSGKLCQQSTQYKNSSQLTTSYNQSRSYPNSNKKQFKQDLFPSYDPNSSANYFTPSLNINTPIIPHPPLIPTPNIPSNEDFTYTSHLNYPSSLSKTSLYPSATQQMNDNNQGGNPMLHGNVGGGGGGGNLVTNFNLSTICPEINDKTRQQNW